MQYTIRKLEIEKWKNFELKFEYTSQHYYDLKTTLNENGMEFQIEKKPFPEPFHKKFSDHLFPDYFDNQEGYAIFDDKKMLGVIALAKEEWNNRLRVCELLVEAHARRSGLGAQLMNIAKTRAKELGCRSIVLETQSCNEKAIEFYFSQGFSLVGFDTNCYSNEDIEKKEIRFELALLIS